MNFLSMKEWLKSNRKEESAVDSTAYSYEEFWAP